LVGEKADHLALALALPFLLISVFILLFPAAYYRLLAPECLFQFKPFPENIWNFINTPWGGFAEDGGDYNKV